MRPSVALQQHRDAVRKIVARHRTTNARVFGSVLTGNDQEDSDLDLLVDPTSETTLVDLGAIRLELRRLLGVEVDVLTPDSIPPSIRDRIVREREPYDSS